MSPEEIKAARARLGLSQSQLARALGTTIKSVSSWECGRSVSPPYLRLALHWLGVRATVDEAV